MFTHFQKTDDLWADFWKSRQTIEEPSEAAQRPLQQKKT